MVSIYTVKNHLLKYINQFNFSSINNDEAIDLIITTYNLILSNITENILDFCYTDRLGDLYSNIIELYVLHFEDILQNKNLDKHLHDEFNNDLINIIIITKKLIHTFVIPIRSYKNTFIRFKLTPNKKINIKNKIEYLKNIPQAEQRTEDWYAFRHNTLTASSIWKVFYSQSSQNQLIYEKCKPITINKSTHVNTETPCHWGNKYEPLSVLYYEFIYNTKIDDFGCIPHCNYSYIAASPDGINCLETNDRYGRMLEIKNIVNREITGIPKMEYWIQMQIQMEVCDLNECDFLETRFIEYQSQEEYLNDPSFNLSNSSIYNNYYRGKILLFQENGVPCYKYHNFGLSITDIDEWEEQQMDIYNDLTWIKTIYWKLSEISCILVLRNKLWFNTANPYIKLLWDIIEKEKNKDYSHRQPKRKKTNNTNNIDTIHIKDITYTNNINNIDIIDTADTIGTKITTNTTYITDISNVYKCLINI